MSANALIGKRLLDYLEAAAKGLGRARRDNAAIERLGQFHLFDAEFVHGIDIAAGKGGELVVLVEIVIVDFVEIGLAAPIGEVLAVGRFRHPLQDAAVADNQLGKCVRTRADRIS